MNTADTPYTILTVCTGNVCRSPLAEHLLRHHLEKWHGVHVHSAGTHALVGQSMTPQTIQLGQPHGITDGTHAARQLDTDHLRQADLILALTRTHRSHIVSMLPRASRNTFTVRELARLLEHITADDIAEIAKHPLPDTRARFTELIHAAAALRGYVPPPANDHDDDVIDPYRQSDEIYQQTAAELVPAITTIAARFDLAAAVTP